MSVTVLAQPMTWCEYGEVITANCSMVTPVVNCVGNYTIYNRTGSVVENKLVSVFNGNIYYIDINLAAGDYLIRLCDNSTREIKVLENEEDNMIITGVMLLPLILTIIFLIGAISLNGEEHPALKIFLFIVSFIPFFISMHIGLQTVAKFYNYPELESIIGDTTYWFVLLFIVILAYFVFWFIAKMFHNMAENKKEKLRY